VAAVLPAVQERLRSAAVFREPDSLAWQRELLQSPVRKRKVLLTECQVLLLDAGLAHQSPVEAPALPFPLHSLQPEWPGWQELAMPTELPVRVLLPKQEQELVADQELKP
jgi:hypothetical protein